MAAAIFFASLSSETAPSEPGHDGNAQPLGGAFRLDLVAHDANMVARRTDEGDVVRSQDVGEASILRQEAVAGMHGIRAGYLAGGDDLVDVEVAVP